jgi:hypothetical protein
MTSTAKQEAEKIEILDHSMTRITVVADGSFDEFQAPIRCHDARFHSPGHRPKVKNWQQAVALVEAKAPFGLLIYRKGDVHSV